MKLASAERSLAYYKERLSEVEVLEKPTEMGGKQVMLGLNGLKNSSKDTCSKIGETGVDSSACTGVK